MNNREGLIREAEAELEQRTRPRKESVGGMPTASFDIELGFGNASIAEPLVAFARSLFWADQVEATAEAMHHYDLALDGWTSARQQWNAEEREAVILPFGVEVRVPHRRDFEV